ncbi:MAG: acetyl-CoA C-acyltransferase [Deltaproteobacteria bacterium]|nr:acetyl-CoA C-acyltransferase [Deltaproteobacteria bacterium]
MDGRDVWILGGARTPMADWVGAPGGGKFKDVSAIELGAVAARAALERCGVRPELVGEVIMGSGLQSSPNAAYGARHVCLLAGLPETVPALNVGRNCASGFQSIICAAKDVLLGEAEFVLAGGMENMSQAPYVIRDARQGFRMGDQKIEDFLVTSLFDSACRMSMGETADKLAGLYGVTREQADAFACESHRRAAAAARSGIFREEIVRVDVETRRGTAKVDADDHIRPDTNLEALAKIRPASGVPTSLVTGGNASGIVDAAAAVVVSSAGAATRLGLPRLGRLAAWAVVGVDPSLMGIGAARAIEAVLERAGMRLEAIDLFEINEAFAAQYLAVERHLGLDPERVNVNGGAIALGHPLGMTGTRLTHTLLLELRRRSLQYGVASACVGGGQGVAVLVEAFPD